MSTTETAIAQPPNDNFSIETLFQAAFDRTKERFFSYLLALLLMYAMFFGGLLGAALLTGLHFLIWTMTQSIPAVATLAIISSVAALTGLMYLGSWATLATTYTLIAPHAIGVMDAYKQMRPLVWGHVLLSFLISLFIFGIFPISIFTFFILLLLWMVWALFSVFVYIEKQEKGLAPLWISQAIVNQRFWGVFGRVILLYVGMWVIFGVLAAGSEKYPVLNTVSFIASLLLSPFALSYFYEIYTRLPHPSKTERPTVWIVLSIIGWVVMVLAVISISLFTVQQMPGMMKDLDKQIEMKKTGTI